MFEDHASKPEIYFPDEAMRDEENFEEEESEGRLTGRRRIIEYVPNNDAVNEILNTGDCKDVEGILEVHQDG